MEDEGGRPGSIHRRKAGKRHFLFGLPAISRNTAIVTTKYPILPRSREFMCRHNRKYWSHVPYLGLGPSAHSFQAGSRWWNVKSIKKYCQLLAEGKAPVEASEVLSEEQLDLESLALGFRTSDGVDLHAPGGGLRSGKALEELQKSGLVKVNNGRIQPTRKGFLVADSLPLMF